MILSPTLITDAGVVMLVVLVVLGFATTVSKTFRARHDHRALLRVRKLRPLVLAAMEHPADNVATLSQLPRKERDAFVALARGLLPHLRGVDRERLVQILETTRLIDAALRQTHSRSPIRRARAAELLGLAGVARSQPELVRLLRDRDRDVRRTAARALGIVGDPRSVRALLDSLDGPRAVPVNAVTMAILRIGAPATTELRSLLLHGPPATRAVAAELLGLIGSTGAVPGLVGVLESDAGIELHIRAARALGRIGAPQATAALAACLAPDQPAPLRAVAARALGDIGGVRALSVLLTTTRSPEHVVASNAARALVTVGGEGITMLRHAATQPGRAGAYAREALSVAGLDADELDPRGVA